MEKNSVSGAKRTKAVKKAVSAVNANIKEAKKACPITAFFSFICIFAKGLVKWRRKYPLALTNQGRDPTMILIFRPVFCRQEVML